MHVPHSRKGCGTYVFINNPGFAGVKDLAVMQLSGLERCGDLRPNPF